MTLFSIHCQCSQHHTRASWLQLARKGVKKGPYLLEIRGCICGATLSMPVWRLRDDRRMRLSQRYEYAQGRVSARWFEKRWFWRSGWNRACKKRA